MKTPRVVRKVRIDGRRVFAAVAGKDGKLDFGRVEHKGKLIPASAGTFYLDYRDANGRRVRRAVGDDAAAVKRALVTQTQVLELRRRGVEVNDAPELVSAQRPQGTPLASIASAFRTAPPARLSRKSALKYRNALESFAAWARTSGVTHALQVDARVVDRWVKHLRDAEALDNSTVRHKVMIVVVELRKHGATIAIHPRDLPRVTEREREAYDVETLQALFAVCRPHELVLYKTFLLTGMREQEVAFLSWDDIDAKRSTVRVSRKPQLGFTPKNYQERTVAVPRELIAMLLQHQESTKATAGLVFATAKLEQRGMDGGKRDKKMLAKLKQIAKRAGLNCGHCLTKHQGRTVSCATHPVCRKFGLHKFRHTYATNLLRDKVDIVSVQAQLGHKDLESTRPYLHALTPEHLQPVVEGSTLARRFAPRLHLVA